MAVDDLPESAWFEALSRDCLCDLPELAREAISKFNAGEYYEQHDLLETLWRNTDAPVRQLYQAILQIGIAYYQVEQGNWRGALKMLDRGLRWMRRLPDACQGVDVNQLRSQAETLRSELKRVGETGMHTIDRSVFRGVPLVSKG